jgi:hypothetical protein
MRQQHEACFCKAHSGHTSNEFDRSGWASVSLPHIDLAHFTAPRGETPKQASAPFQRRPCYTQITGPGPNKARRIQNRNTYASTRGIGSTSGRHICCRCNPVVVGTTLAPHLSPTTQSVCSFCNQHPPEQY